MEQLRAMLTRKLGPLPAWVWALLVAGGILGVAYYRRMGSDDAEYEVAPETVPWAGDVGDEDAADAGDIEGIPTIPEHTVSVTTNPAWVRYVTDRLVASGEDPVAVNNALTKALAGIELTAQEKALWNIAVSRYGAPPEGAPPIVGPPTPGPYVPPPATGTSKPGAPTGLRVLSPSRTQMTIGWNATSGATAYQVAVVSRAQYLPWSTNTNVHKGFTIRDLKAGTTYRVQVRARNSAGNGPWSAPLNIRTPR